MGEETKKSVIRDILTRKLPVAIENDERISEEVAELAVIHQRMRNEMIGMEKDMAATRTALRTFVTDYFSDLILQAED